MITFFIGSRSGSAPAYQKRLDEARAKKYEEVFFDGTNWDENTYTSLLEGGGLFGVRRVCVIREALDAEIPRTFFLSRLSEAKASENIFLACLEKVSAEEKRVLASFGETVFLEKPKEKRDFNVFSLADALLSGERKTLWVRYREAISSGATPEEICGTLFWQMKTLLLVSGGAEEGMKPFTRDKARRALAKFPAEKARKKARELLILYHEGRAEGGSLEISLERFILSF